MSIYTDIAGQIQRLKTSPAIEVKYHKDTLTPPSQIETVRGTLGSVFDLQCPPSVANSVEIDDELYVYWKSREQSAEDAVFGEFFLRSVLVFGLTNDLSPTFLSQPYGDIDLRNTRVFDYYAYNGGPIHALLPASGQRIEDGVLIFNEKQVWRTSLDYATYLDVLRRTRGFLFWQYLFCDRIRVEQHEMVALKRGFAFVEREFPGDDYSDLRERLRHLERGQ
jgi:hypothetical protein